jgi:hypothetical protein
MPDKPKSSMTTWGAEMLREMADTMDKESKWVEEMRLCLRNIVEQCPWELDAGGSPAFWYNMRKAKMLIQQIDAEVGT